MSVVPTLAFTMGFALDHFMDWMLDSSVSVKKVLQEHSARHLSLVRFCVEKKLSFKRALAFEYNKAKASLLLLIM